MKYAICNEIFEGWPTSRAFTAIREAGYDGVEIAPFTLDEGAVPFDVHHVTAAEREEVREIARSCGLEIIGLHWLFAKTDGLYLTSPDQATREKTVDYLSEVTRLCSDLGGHVMVLGSPQQRNLLPGVSHDDAMEYAADVLRCAMPLCQDLGITLAVEPLGPAEGDFLRTAKLGRQLVRLVDSPSCQLHLDVKAMSSEEMPIPEIIRESGSTLAHFHANDKNLLGPGMGEIDFAPIFAALRDVGYNRWVSVETFDRSVDPVKIAKDSIDYMRRIE